MKFKKVLILFFIVFFYTVSYCQEKSVVYIMDNSYLGDNTKEYFYKLGKKLENDNVISLIPISKNDINTSEALDILKNIKKKNATIILNVGEANYYNLYGFSVFGKYKHKNRKNKVVSVRDINIEIAKQYSVLNKNTFTDLINIVGRQLFIDDSNRFKPLVIPKFYLLNSSSAQNINVASSVTSYTYAWNLIYEGKFDEAHKFLVRIINKQPNQSMFHYALGALHLLKDDEKYYENALRAFEDGILADPFNKDNLCYKGLVVMFMMYEGEIIKDILFFSGLLDKYMPNISKDISAILSIGNCEYDKKIEIINKWILTDIDLIKQLCDSKNINLVLTSYPVSVRSENVMKQYSKEHKTVSFIDDKVKSDEDISEWINNSVSRIYLMLKQKGFINE
ncbi:tetratricopeptide repeat protein [Candidatus Ruminimicrobium bovinum]|uniref:tetratricopeptide repeat protein n=1 Tax=Candidatus Ruminimicrobium bovinum TaxID=3242779 RepID=UPI0039B9AC79